MKDSVRHCGTYCHSLWGSLPASPIRLELETCCFLIASVLDIFMTYTLLNHEAVEFIESNPIARTVLDSWGFFGMACFKLLFSMIVVLIAQVIARHKLLTARRLYHASTSIVSCVVLYSVYLMVAHT